MAKPRVFVSFDFDNDRFLRDALIGQAKLADSPFEIEDWSLKEAQPEANWLAEARKKIKRSKYFVIVVGVETHKAPGVKKEAKIAEDEEVTRFQIKSADKLYQWVDGGGRHLSWTWENLKNYLV